jgi:hypothetical protein
VNVIDGDSDPRDDDRFLFLQTVLDETFENLVFQLVRNGSDKSTAIELASQRMESSLKESWEPVFNAAGYISPELICTEEELFHWFGWNNERQALLERIRKWIELGRKLGAKSLLIDGSFITAKKTPGDVDAVIFLPDDFEDKLSRSDADAIRLSEMLASRKPKELFAAQTEESWWKWFAFFSRTREASGQIKRLVRISLERPND